MDISTIEPSGQVALENPKAGQQLRAEDFLQLLITQLTSQDPLNPTSNQDLLNQLSSINEIQQSTTLVDTMKSLTDHQRFGAAAELIGKHVTGSTTDGLGELAQVSGTVIGARFDADGGIRLELDNGAQLPMSQLETVTTAETAAEGLIGRTVRGLSADRMGEDGQPELIEGVVTAVGNDDHDSPVLELDTGEALPLRNVVTSS